MFGNPARKVSGMSRHSHRLVNPDPSGFMHRPESGFRYKEVRPGVLCCLDLDEASRLPKEMNVGSKTYEELKGHLASKETLS
jgi:hypothetical protein